MSGPLFSRFQRTVSTGSTHASRAPTAAPRPSSQQLPPQLIASPKLSSADSSELIPHALFHCADFRLAAALVILQPSSGKIVVVYDTATGEWFVPRGRKDAGESIEQAALREGYEEVRTAPPPHPTVSEPRTHAVGLQRAVPAAIPAAPPRARPARRTRRRHAHGRARLHARHRHARHRRRALGRAAQARRRVRVLLLRRAGPGRRGTSDFEAPLPFLLFGVDAEGACS
jgi:hypothetical protein